MSRRLRKEKEKGLLQGDDANQEEDKIKVQMARIFAPLVWRQSDNGIKVQDMKQNFFNDVLKMIEEYYFPEEVLSRNAYIAEDDVSKASFLNKSLFDLKHKTSLIAINEKKDNEIAGFIILKALHKSDYGAVFDRAFSVQGEAHEKCVKLLNYLSRRLNVFRQYGVDKYLYISLLCVKPEYRKQGIGFKLMESTLDVAKTLKINVVVGIFSSASLQEKAKKIGMEVAHEMYYVNWKEREELIFDEPGVGNYTCAIMAVKLAS